MSHCLKAIQTNGLRKFLEQLYFHSDSKVGVLIGTDALGNKYFESLAEPWGRERWIEYANKWNPEPSRVPAEWHMWLHRMNDAQPPKTKFPYNPAAVAHTENRTATSQRYVPYSTTLHKYFSWEPKVASRP